MEQKECIVVFPVYKSLDNIEIAAFVQAIKMTQNYSHVFIAPKSMVFDSSFDKLKDIEIVRFDNHYFESINGYNRLMIAKEFYKTFSAYNYMLIHQSDAYLFKPELDYWLKKGFDYIGAPWIRPGKILLTEFYKKIAKFIPFIFSEKAKRRHSVRNNTGNGGLSLRRVSSFMYVLDNVPEKLLNTYLQSNDRDYNEDVFWSLEAPRLYQPMKIPKWEEALLFSFERGSEWSYKRIGNKLPFGCHGFARYEPKFWQQHIPALQQNKKN